MPPQGRFGTVAGEVWNHCASHLVKIAGLTPRFIHSRLPVLFRNLFIAWNAS